MGGKVKGSIKPFTSSLHFMKMVSFSKPHCECKLDNHYKIGQALKPNFNKRCPYAHTLYYAHGKHPQWLYFVVTQEVDKMPLIKEFYGPLMRAIEGDAYEPDQNGEFSRQMFEIEREKKQVAAQVLSMVHFAEHVMNKQEVSVDFCHGMFLHQLSVLQNSISGIWESH